MKKFLVFSLIVGMAAGQVFAEDGLTVAGDVKTGLNISVTGDNDPVASMKNSDDAGTPGRVRLNFVYTKGNITVKWRTQMNGTQNGTGDKFQTTLDNVFAYAYAMGDFADNQIRISLGKIDADKPWETSGDEVWASVETLSGARFEFKPKAVQGLNVGFGLPTVPGANPAAIRLDKYLQELIFGARYENDAFDIRVGVQLDSDADGETAAAVDNDSGTKVVWRVNAKAIGTVVPGLSLWANGVVTGIKNIDTVPKSKLATESWLYVKYASGNLTGAALRTAIQTWAEGNVVGDGREMGLVIRPVFTYKLADNIEAGLAIRADLVLAYADGFKIAGEDPAPFDKLTVEPSVNFNLGNGASIKPVYTLTYNGAKGFTAGKDDRVDHAFEVRLVYSF